MSPKSRGDEIEKEAKSDASQSEAQSSWGFSWGTQQDSSAGFVAAAVSPASTGPAAGAATQSPSAASEPGHSGGDDKEENISASEEKSSSVSETESLRDDESKEEKSAVGPRLVPGHSADGGDEVLQSEADEAKEETETARPSASSSLTPGEASASEKELQSEDTGVVQTELEVSKARECMTSVDDEDVAVKSAESQASQVCQMPEASDATVLSAASSTAEQAVGGEETQKNVLAEDLLSARSDSVSPPVEPSQVESETSLSVSSAGYDLAVCDSNISQTSRSSEETFETLSKGSHSSENLGSLDTVVSDLNSDTMVSGEASFAQISTSEGVQATSITSVSSEPVLLSMSTEENNASDVQEDALLDGGRFSPRSHSSLTSEEENEEKSPPSPDASCSQDERSSSVCSPPLDSTATASSNDSSETSRLDSSVDTVIDRSQQLQEDMEVEVEAESGQHWLGDSSLTDLDASTSPSASFVKCMIEDAMGMEDSSKHEDSGSDNHSEEKSESSKVDSEFEKSIYSGHESSDDIETTTSSDIEIISTPTPNGERNIVDLSPLKFSLQVSLLLVI